MTAVAPATVSPALPGASPRALRTQAFRATIDLCRARLAASSYGRFARIAAVLIAAGALGIALALRATDGPAAPVGNLLRKTAGVLAWLAGSALALAAARDGARLDRAEGIEALVAARGINAGLLRAARTLGAMSQIARTVGLPLVVLALGTAVLAPDLSTALRRLAAAVALLAWAIVVAVTLGGLAAASARLFQNRGPSALAAFVIGERVIAEALGLGAWSIPGALKAALSLALGATGVGGAH